MFVGVVDGDDGVAYELRTSVDTLRIASGDASATLAFTASCYMKSGNSAPSAYACYFSVYFRTGTGQSQAARDTGKVSSMAFSGITVAKTVGAVVIYATDTVVGANAAAPTTFLAKKEIAVVADGDKGADGKHYVEEFARGSSRTNYAPQYIDSRSVTSPVDGIPGWSSSTVYETTSYPYVWMRTCEYNPANDTYGEWAYVCLTGKKGDDGIGVTGKMCYIAGEYDPTIIYRSDDRQTVAVEVYDGSGSAEIYYLDAATNLDADNNHISPQQDTGHTIWKQGLNRENLIRTKYLFADFANLGAFIVSGQWQMSASGVIRGMDASGNPTFTRYNTTDPDHPAMHGGVAAYTGFNSDDPLGQGVDKQTGSITRTLARNTAQSDRYMLMHLTAGRDLYVEASGYANGYSETRLALYRNNGSSWVLVQDLMTFTSTTNATKRATYVCSETAYYYLRLEHATTSSSSYGSSQVTVAVAREYGFTPTQAVDGLTGAMIGALGNFAVEGNGEVNIAGGKVHVDADGNVTMDNVTIRGSLMYHSVLQSSVSASERGCQLFSMYGSDGLEIPIGGTGTVVRTVLKCDHFVLTGAKRNYVVYLPPASLFPGVRIKIVNGTYSGGNGVSKNLDLSQITLAVVYRSDTEEMDDNNYGYAKNNFNAAIPFVFSSGSDSVTLVGAPDSSKLVSLGNDCYGLTMSLTKLYRSVEIISEINKEAGDGKSYAWMIISANE